ncbi:MAG: DNA polymerase domain-containing protein [Firmicutes bacterium]|nr:DNA polymerase domain-containing protein [Bacillota bacterium]
MSPTLKENEKKITFTNLQKELWPGEGLDKYKLIKYYLDVSSYMLPHLKNRFLVFQRFPGGIHKKGFFQKNCPQGAPAWIKTLPFEHDRQKTTNYILASGPETLTWLGNQACLEIHQWLSSINTLDCPDFAVFDLDPMEGVAFSKVCTIALALQRLLKQKNLRCYPKTSGSRGIQVYLPLYPVYSYEHVRKYCEDVFKEVYKLYPTITTLEKKVSKRGPKIYLDYLQNAKGKTLIAPYSPRPLPGAPVSAPLKWEEVAAVSFLPTSFNIRNILPRLHEKGDLFAPVLQDLQRI